MDHYKLPFYDRINFFFNGNIVSWNWDLGGVNSSLQNPGRIFGTPGLYTICLTVTDSNGATDTECKTDFVQVFNLPEPAFTASPTEGCSPLDVTFEDLSTSVDGDIVEWIWGVGGTNGVIIDDGSLPSITNTYILPDDFSVSLTVFDENGCTNTTSIDDFITVIPQPDVQISYSDSFNCDPPLIVDFTNENPEPNVIYFWDMGNGDPIFQGPNPPTAVYTEIGSHTITVIAEDQISFCRDTAVFEEIVHIGVPVNFTTSQNEGCITSVISYYDQSQIPADSILWDFGDNTTSTLINPTHSYSQIGCYTVTLTRWVNGCATTESSENCIDIYDVPDVSFINQNPTGCTIPHTVSFFESTANVVDTWFWDFGDGATSTSSDTIHTYTEFGIYPVTLTVTDIFGCSNSYVDTVRIIETEASFDLSQLVGCAPLTVNLEDNAVTASPIVSWDWQIDTSFSDPNSPLFTSNDATPSLVIADTGLYDVQLIVTNSLGCTDTIFYPEAIGVGMTPVINFEADPLLSCSGDAIQFTDLSSPFVNEWLWEFGDSTFSNEQNPSHEYDAADTFDVTLTVFHNGCFSTLTYEDYIITILPVGGFSLVRDCDDPYFVQFNDGSQGADSVFWDFGILGDLDTSTLFSPSFSFPDTGCYMVSQTVFNFTTGCEDEESVEICITDPIAAFELDTLAGCAPLTVNLIDNSIFAEQWEWVAPQASITTMDSINYSLTYNDPGTYNDIKLIITDMNGCQDSTVFGEDLLVNGVTADFLSLPNGGCAPLNVQFSDNSTSLFGNIVNWEWQFGSIVYPDNIPNPSYEFNAVGNYDVSLSVTDDWGCVGNLNLPEAIHATEPVPLFGGDTLGCTNVNASFINQSTGESLTYFWEFGDNGTSTDEDPTHQYSAQGIYEVCLTITDLYGCSKTYCHNIEIVNPIADFDLDQTYSNCPPLLVNFQNLSSNASVFEWDFGDGSGVSNQENPPHVYTVPGTYDVSLIASSTQNCSDTLLIEELIVLEGPLGSFYFDIDSACVPATITFYGESDDYYDYIWDFGNGDLDTVSNVIADTTVHVFNEAGVFFPNLILINSTNCQRALESPIPIVLEQLDVDFAVLDTLLCGITEVQFLNLTNSTEPINSIEWYFEGGTPTFSNDFEPVVNYESSGNFDVMLRVDNGFCLDSLTKENYINNALVPQANFSQSASTGCSPIGIQYFDESTIASGTIETWRWDLGDGNTSDIADPYHVYQDSGSMPVQLVVTSDMGCQDSITSPIAIYAPPEVFIGASEPEICIGDYIELTAFLWDTTGIDYSWIPDNSLSCLNCFQPIANPNETTTYSFIATNEEGCADTSQVTVDVLPYEIPTITITGDTSICLGETIQLFVEGGDSPTSYDWDEGTEGLSCYENCQNPFASPVDTSTYYITVTNMYGCDAQDSVEVAVIDQWQPFAGEDEVICEGDSIQLSLSLDGEINWLITNGLSCVDCNDPIASPNSTTNYAVSLITPDYGCEIIDSVLVTVLSPDDIDAGEDVQICDGETISLNGSGDGTVIWSPSDYLNDPNVLSPEVNPSESITYFLSLENGNCILEDSVYISVVYETDISANDYFICEGDTIELEPFGLADSYQWTPSSSLSDSLAQNPLAFPTETTTYLLEASQTTCLPDTATSTVVVDPLPNVSLPSRIPFFEGEPIAIEVTALDNRNYSYFWTTSDSLSCSSCSNTIFTSSIPMLLEVIVTDLETGCEITLYTEMDMLDYCNGNLISVPNTFTPNNDGFNDELFLISNTITKINTFKIFDRWGGLVFETDDFYEPWDGKSNGKEMPIGVYVYFIEAECDIDGTKFLKKGDITILR